MIRKPAFSLLAAALLAGLALAGCRSDEPAPPEPVAAAATAPAAPAAAASTAADEPAPAPLATVTSVELGSELNASSRVITPATSFGTGDTIYASASVTTSDASAPVREQLTARWTYAGNQLVDETSRDYVFTGPAAAAFKIAKPDGWPVGEYRVEIIQGGEVVQTRDFEIR